MPRIGILQTGRVLDHLGDRFGQFPAMFAAALGPHLPHATFHTWCTVDGELPHSPRDADGWLVTGSRHGVRDDLPWMAPLMDFLRDCLAQEVPVVGVCFGHQILAEAMGGHVDKSPRGWGLGVMHYETTPDLPAEFAGLAPTYASHAVHQDQVLDLPPSATVLAGNAHCPYAALLYGDPDRPLAISVQSHPEFDLAFMEALLDTMVQHRSMDPALVDAATLGDEVANQAWYEAWSRVLGQGHMH
jgi:GMP synthase-like glutamine amidotransferase